MKWQMSSSQGDPAPKPPQTDPPRVRAAGGPPLCSTPGSCRPRSSWRRIALVVHRRRRPEQPGHDHLHRLQRAGRPGDRRVADRRRSQPGRDARRAPRNQPDQSGQNLAWSLGTIQGYDRAQRDADGQPAEPEHARSSTPGRRLRHARRRRRLDATPAAPCDGERRPEPARLDARRQHERPVHPGRGGEAQLRPAADLQLPAHADRLQLVSRLGPRCARDALVERRATRSTSPAWAWP